MRRVRAAIVAVAAIRITYCGCVFVALGIPTSYYIVICSLPGSTIFFPHYLKNGKIFRKKKGIEHNMCFDFLYEFCLKHFSFYETERDVLINVYWSSCQVPVILDQC
jgi:hypothetical protein